MGFSETEMIFPPSKDRGGAELLRETAGNSTATLTVSFRWSPTNRKRPVVFRVTTCVASPNVNVALGRVSVIIGGGVGVKPAPADRTTNNDAQADKPNRMRFECI